LTAARMSWLGRRNSKTIYFTAENEDAAAGVRGWRWRAGAEAEKKIVRGHL